MTTYVPYSTEAEEALLGAVISNPNAFKRLTYLRADDFYLARHQTIWQAMKALDDSGVTIDYVSLQALLKQRNAMDDIGGIAYLTQLVTTGISVNFDTYGRIIEDASVRRNLMRTADTVKQLAANEAIDLDTVLARTAESTLNVRRPSLTQGVTAHDAVMAHFTQTEERMANPQKMVGPSWSIAGLNAITRGKRKKLYVFAGRPGMGKSSALISEFVHSCREGNACRFNTIEMTRDEILTIMLAMVSGVPTTALESGMMDKQQWAQYVKASGTVAEWNFVIDDNPRITPMSLYTVCLDQRYNTGLQEVYIDYLQLMHADGIYANRVKEVDSIAHGLAEMAKQLDATVIAAAQLSRAVEQRQDKRPLLSDLREAGGIENEAYAALLLYREDYYKPPLVPAATSKVEINIAKNRGGGTGVTECMMHFPTRQFKNIARHVKEV